MRRARTRSKNCDRCAKAPSTTKLEVAGFTVNGRTLVDRKVKQRLCDGCACKTMREFTNAIVGASR